MFRGGLHPRGANAAARMLKHVREGGSAAVMADLRDSGDLLVPFFGRPAPSTPFPAMLARRVGRPLFAACLVRTGRARFRLLTEIIEVPHSNDRDEDVRIATARVQQVFEAWIRAWPGQWMWAHTRYRSESPGA
jgi:KDO2-lipid IV(A) lauroyltransferase